MVAVLFFFKRPNYSLDICLLTYCTYICPVTNDVHELQARGYTTSSYILDF